MTFVPPPALVDRAYISQYAIEDIGVLIHVNGALTDADGDDVDATIVKESDNSTVVVYAAEHDETGVYHITTTASNTQEPGLYHIDWTFEVGGTPQTLKYFFEIGPAQYAYDSLSVGMKATVDNVWWKFADLFDSPDGGPNLGTYFQTNWSRGRMAQIMVSAINRLNIVSQPKASYTAYAPSEFPIEKWGGLLELATYVEAIKHLIRSYVEQPDAVGINVPRLDRKDYMSRWQTVLAMEQSDLERATELFKIAHMNLGRARVLVSGGAYGNYSPTRLPVSAAARPRYWARFY